MRCEFFNIPVCECNSECGDVCTQNYSLTCQWAIERRKAMEEKESMFEFYVAGVQHHELHKCIKEVKVGDVLGLSTEPTNPYDPNAVRIEYASLNQDEVFMLGYVPKAKGDYSSKVSAAMMIKDLMCTVVEINPEAKTWEQLKVAVMEV